MKRQISYQVQVLDQTRVHDLRQAHRATDADLVAQSAQIYRANLEKRSTSNNDQTEVVEDTRASVGSRVHGTTTEVDADSDAVHEDIRNIVAIMDETPPSTMPLALMTYDLSTVETVSDPQDFFDECMVLEQ